MAEQFEPLEIRCDAPPYGIVRGCRFIGMRDPEDVAWYRLSRYHQGWPERFDLTTWNAFLAPGARCLCGRDLPRLEAYEFTLVSGDEVRYLLGQCAGCRTVFWEEAPARVDRPAAGE
jgi:hypothetical protein